MDNKKTINTDKKIPSRSRIAVLGILGFMIAYLGASIDDTRDAATPEQRTHIPGLPVTLTMEGIGMLCMARAGALLMKRQDQR